MASFDLLDNGGFEDPLPDFTDARGVRRVPWWESSAGGAQLGREAGRAFLRTGPGQWARQPVAAYAPLADRLRVSGEVRGRGVVTLIDGEEGRASVALEADPAEDGFRRFEIGGADLARALGRPLVPRFVLELTSAADANADWRGLEVLVALPTPTPDALRAEILDELRWIFALWLARRDDVGPEPTAFLAHVCDVVSGARLYPMDGGHNIFFSLLLDVLEVEQDPTWGAALTAFLADFLERGLDPETGLPRMWDTVLDRPRDDRFIEIASTFGFLIDLAERGPEAFRSQARAAAVRIGETVLARGVLPDGTIAPRYRPADAEPSDQTVLLRRLDLPAQLGRLSALTGDPRFLDAARAAVAVLEYTHYWPGSWQEIDPGFDDNFGHYGARALVLWRSYPDDPTFRRLARGGLLHYAPLWADALRLGGNVAADQVRCWQIAAGVARLEPELRPEVEHLLRAAVRSHFKGEQYGNGAWGDVTIFGFDPQGHLQVGDLTGVPQNLLHGLAIAYPAEGGETATRRELRALFTTVLRSSRTAYRREHGYLSTRSENDGVNVAMGSLRLAVGLVEMSRRL